MTQTNLTARQFAHDTLGLDLPASRPAPAPVDHVRLHQIQAARLRRLLCIDWWNAYRLAAYGPALYQAAYEMREHGTVCLEAAPQDWADPSRWNVRETMVNDDPTPGGWRSRFSWRSYDTEVEALAAAARRSPEDYWLDVQVYEPLAVWQDRREAAAAAWRATQEARLASLGPDDLPF